MEEETGLSARWRYYIDRSFQNQFLFRFSAVALMVSIFALAALWLVHENAFGLLPDRSTALFSLKEAPGADGAMCRLPDGEELPAVRPGRSFNAFELYWRPIAVVSAFNLVFIAVFALFYSHSMAGPMFNIKRALRDIIDSGEARPIRIRKGDQFQDLAELINELIEKRVK